MILHYDSVMSSFYAKVEFARLLGVDSECLDPVQGKSGWLKKERYK